MKNEQMGGFAQKHGPWTVCRFKGVVKEDIGVLEGC